MRKFYWTFFWGFWLQTTFAQVPQPDSLRLWFSVEWEDTASVFRIQPSVFSYSLREKYLHYQVRIAKHLNSNEQQVEKLKGVFFALPFDTTAVLEKNITFQPDDDFDIHFFVLEGDYVVAYQVWNFAENFALHKNAKPKPRPKLTFLAKDDFEIDALVFNETRTPFGREFFRIFNEQWQAPEGVSGYWITIRETLTPGRFTLLSVSLNNRELFQRYLIPRQEFMESLAQQTAEYLLSLLQNGNFEGGLTQEDLMGVGIE